MLLERREKLLGITLSLVLTSFLLSIVTFVVAIVGIADKSTRYYAFFEEPTFYLCMTSGLSTAISLIMTFDWEWNVFHGGSFKENRKTELWRGTVAGVLSFIAATIASLLFQITWAWIPVIFILTGVLQISYGVMVRKWYKALDPPVQRLSTEEGSDPAINMAWRLNRPRGLSSQSSQALSMELSGDSMSEEEDTSVLPGESRRPTKGEGPLVTNAS